MKMARKTVSLDEKIKKAEATVIALKAKLMQHLMNWKNWWQNENSLKIKKSSRLIIMVVKPLMR